MISLDKNLYLKNGVIIYDDPNYKVYRRNLKVESMDFLDDISVKWLPDNLDEGDGSHNGQNYVAYSFYIENTGKDAVDYWTEFIIDDAIKNVDEAIRIRIYFDGKSALRRTCSLSLIANKVNLNSFYLNSEIKKHEPMLLINFYEEHLVFPECKNKK